MGARIIAGQWGGRTLAVPRTDATRPMTDRVRGALFNILGDIAGTRVLDVYAGSGAVGLEALSRGAARLTLVEQNRSALNAISDNVNTLGAKAAVVGRSVEQWLNAAPKHFDLILADPPYDELDAGVLDKIGGLLAAGGRMVVSHSSRTMAPELQSLQLVRTAKYGDSSLSFYEHR